MAELAQGGYTLNERVLRPARVLVATPLPTTAPSPGDAADVTDGDDVSEPVERENAGKDEHEEEAAVEAEVAVSDPGTREETVEPDPQAPTK